MCPLLLLHLFLLFLIMIPVLLCVCSTSHHHLHEHIGIASLGPHGLLIVGHQVPHHLLLPLILILFLIVLFILFVSPVLLLLLFFFVFIAVLVVFLLFNVLELPLEMRFGDSLLLGFLHLARPKVAALFFRHRSGRFLSLFKREGGAIVAEGRLEIKEQGSRESLLSLVCLIVEDWVAS